MSETGNSYTSPFENGDWGRWTNLERFSWLKGFHDDVEGKREAIAKGFKLDEAKMKRLADAVELLRAKLLQEINITQQAADYGEAVMQLSMDAVLRSKNLKPAGYPAFDKPKRINNKGN